MFQVDALLSKKEKRNILITGAGFGNKGAQAMIFVTVSVLKKRYPDCSFYVVSKDDYDKPYKDDYTFKFINKPSTKTNYFLAFSHLNLLNKKNPEYENYKTILENTCAIIDISGYAFSSKWGVSSSLYYLSYIVLGKKWNIPVYLMPQSFGPFEYGNGFKCRILKIVGKKYLKSCKCIYAREKKSKTELCNEFGLKNVIISNDLVLQSRSLGEDTIFKHKINFTNINTKPNSVMIVPNMQILNRGKKELAISIYKTVIRCLTDYGYYVYLVAQANSDVNICDALYCNNDNNNVEFLRYDFSCIEYDMLVQKMEFIVSSRYHSIVLGYRNYIHAIVCGWSDKYVSLMKSVSQDQYYIDLNTKEALEKILLCIDKMNNNKENEKLQIKTKMKKIQEECVFDDIVF